MFKKCVIILFFTTAYSVLLAHNFTPHQHGTEKVHHHHHGHDHNDDGHNDENETNPFHYFQHNGEMGIEFVSGNTFKLGVRKIFCKAAFITLYDIFFTPFEKPPLIVPLTRTERIAIPKTQPYFFPLKAPPAFIA
jgi:hypothetical protein